MYLSKKELLYQKYDINSVDGITNLELNNEQVWSNVSSEIAIKMCSNCNSIYTIQLYCS